MIKTRQGNTGEVTEHSVNQGTVNQGTILCLDKITTPLG